MAEYKNGKLAKEYIYLNGQLVAINLGNDHSDTTNNANHTLGSELAYVQNDHLGRPQVVTNQNKDVVWQANNQAFDRVVTTNKINDLNLGFPGQYFDKESGLYYNINRDYDPSAGRYVQSDPIGLGGGLNTYSYASNDPVNKIDKSGLQWISLGEGYVGRIDRFEYKGEVSHEIHVYDDKGNEVGVHGPKGWINKHGHKGSPVGLPEGVANQVKGSTIDELRKCGRFPDQGTVNIKGDRWLYFVKFGGVAAVVGNLQSVLSIERMCGMEPTAAGC